MTVRRAVKATALNIFWARCEARAHLYAVDELDLHAAVDGLQEYADQHGVVAELGQDATQAILTEAFRRAHAKRRATMA
jgi:hypothetical protein